MNKALDHALSEAVLNQDKSEIERLLFMGANINGVIGEDCPSHDGDLRVVVTELLSDHSSRQPELFPFIDWLIHRGLTLVVPNGLNDMPLYFPVYGGDLITVRGLLERGSDPNNWCVNVFGKHTALDVVNGRFLTHLESDERSALREIEHLLVEKGGLRYVDLVENIANLGVEKKARTWKRSR